MGPKINGLSISDLVSTAVEKRLAEELGVYKDLLDNALARIMNLEEEMTRFREMSNNNFPISKSPSKSDIYFNVLGQVRDTIVGYVCLLYCNYVSKRVLRRKG